MSKPSKNVLIGGLPGAGVKTVIGSLLYKCNGVSLQDLQTLEQRGIRDYRRLPEELERLGKPLRFETAKFWVNMTSISKQAINTASSDYGTVMIVVSPDTIESIASSPKFEELRSSAVSNVMIVVNKMDTVDWSEIAYDKVVSQTVQAMNIEKFKSIPYCAHDGSNLFELAKNTPWYAACAGSSSLVRIIDEMFEER